MDTATWRAFLAQKHTPGACPCRKRHEAAPRPTLPPLPPSFNAKAARRYRETLEVLEEAQNTEDDRADTRARKKLAEQEAILGDPTQIAEYKTLVEGYHAQLDGWRNDTCGACGASLLVPDMAKGCTRCLSEAEAALAAVLGALCGVCGRRLTAAPTTRAAMLASSDCGGDCWECVSKIETKEKMP
jgi:hypothetical protein